MGKVLIRRIVFSVFVLFAVSAITFAILMLASGNPARLLAGPQATDADVAALQVRLGLDRPLWEQYGRYLGRVLSGDFGSSIVTNRPILEEILHRAPATLELMSSALCLALAIGIPLGIWAARHKDAWQDQVVRAIAVLSISMPSFWIGMLLVLVFYSWLSILPSAGRFAGADPAGPTGFLTLDTLLRGDVEGFLDALRHLALPASALALVELGGIARLVRAQMLGVLKEDYILVARASGLSERTVITQHALRNALTPLITVLGLAIAQMLYGSVVIETVFGWPGTGNYVVQAIFTLDFPVILGFAVIASTAYVVINLLVDLTYAALDPRIRSVA